MGFSEMDFHLKNCLECGKQLRGRFGKKYCDPACKSAYHNRHKGLGETAISQTNRILRRNRSVLKTLCPKGKATVRKEVLDELAYDFRFFTGLFKSQENLYYLVYDYAFSPILESGIQKVLIVQRQGYMDKLGFEIWKK